MVNEAMNIGKKREVQAGNLMGGNEKRPPKIWAAV